MALRLDDDDALVAEAPVGAARAGAPSPRRAATSATTSKRRWIALETLLTFWPPAPCARTAVISTSASSTTGGVTEESAASSRSAATRHRHRDARRARTSARSRPSARRARRRRSTAPRLCSRGPRATTSLPTSPSAPGRGRPRSCPSTRGRRCACARRRPAPACRLRPVQARIAVGVAAGRDADAHRRVGGEAAAVADAGAGGELLDRDQPRAQRHRRRRPQCGAVVSREVGRRAVEQDARAHPVAAPPAARRAPSAASPRCCRPSARRAGRASPPRTRRARARRRARRIGVGEMRHQRRPLRPAPARRGAATRRGKRRARSRAGSCRCSSSGRRGAAGRS